MRQGAHHSLETRQRISAKVSAAQTGVSRPRQRLTMCRKGLHPMEPDNVYVGRNGQRKCRECIRITDRARMERDREKRNEAGRKRWAAKDKREQLAYRLLKYGLSVDEYEARVVEQQGRCAICGTNSPGGRWGARLVVDHDHTTGLVRGLLCAPCNSAIGLLADSPEVLRAAASYLDRNSP